MLLIFRPFKIGDAVRIGGIQGTLKELALFWTELVTGDNVRIILPNSGVVGSAATQLQHRSRGRH
jgi:small conductance mechanosensitive channel